MPEDLAIQEEQFSGRLNLGVWKHVGRLMRAYPGMLWQLVIVAVVMGMMRVAFTVMTWLILREMETLARSGAIWWYFAGYFGVVVAWAVSVGWFIRVAGRLSTRFSHDLRQQAFEHLQRLSFSYYDRRAAGWLVARLTSDCDRLARAISWSLFDLIWGPTLLVGLAAAMLFINAKLTGVMVSIVVPLALVSYVFEKWMLGASRDVRKSNSTITASFAECIQGVRTTKALVREQENLDEFQTHTAKMFDCSVRSAVLKGAYYPIVFSVMSVATGMALWAGGIDVRIGAMGLGTLIFFLYCAREFVWPVMDMSSVFAEIQTAQAAAERIIGLLNTTPDVKDSPEVRLRIAAAQARPEQREGRDLAPDGLPNVITRVEFRNVCFHYVPGQPVLENFNLSVDRGSTVALVGPTGGGKTTIGSLLCRFYEPTAGEILIDGRDYRTRSLHWLQSNLGIVLQQPHLFAGSVGENIRYGCLDATDEDVAAAAKMVHAHEFITALEDGYDTQVGEGGNRLSTGQRQLISFARAVLADPKIFIMDEATSSVDTETEQLIQRGLAAVLSGRISFIIAHRLSTIRGADTILLIDGGTVVEQGSHADLMSARGRYWRLYTYQFTEQRTSELLGRGDA